MAKKQSTKYLNVTELAKYVKSACTNENAAGDRAFDKLLLCIQQLLIEERDSTLDELREFVVQKYEDYDLLEFLDSILQTESSERFVPGDDNIEDDRLFRLFVIPVYVFDQADNIEVINHEALNSLHSLFDTCGMIDNSQQVTILPQLFTVNQLLNNNWSTIHNDLIITCMMNSEGLPYKLEIDPREKPDVPTVSIRFVVGSVIAYDMNEPTPFLDRITDYHDEDEEDNDIVRFSAFKDESGLTGDALIDAWNEIESANAEIDVESDAYSIADWDIEHWSVEASTLIDSAFGIKSSIGIIHDYYHGLVMGIVNLDIDIMASIIDAIETEKDIDAEDINAVISYHQLTNGLIELRITYECDGQVLTCQTIRIPPKHIMHQAALYDYITEAIIDHVGNITLVGGQCFDEIICQCGNNLYFTSQSGLMCPACNQPKVRSKKSSVTLKGLNAKVSFK